jgi:hypothetical protein
MLTTEYFYNNVVNKRSHTTLRIPVNVDKFDSPTVSIFAFCSLDPALFAPASSPGARYALYYRLIWLCTMVMHYITGLHEIGGWCARVYGLAT